MRGEDDMSDVEHAMDDAYGLSTGRVRLVHGKFPRPYAASDFGPTGQ